MADIDIRPVNLERLTQFTDAALVSRKERIDTHLAHYEAECVQLSAALEAAEKLVRFLQVEQDAAVLARRLQEEEIVRVKCPLCHGSGMKPTDTTSGQLHKQSAFETIGQTPAPTKTLEIDPADRCVECKGKRWVLMERFKG